MDLVVLTNQAPAPAPPLPASHFLLPSTYTYSNNNNNNIPWGSLASFFWGNSSCPFYLGTLQHFRGNFIKKSTFQSTPNAWPPASPVHLSSRHWSKHRDWATCFSQRLERLANFFLCLFLALLAEPQSWPVKLKKALILYLSRVRRVTLQACTCLERTLYRRTGR